MTRPVRPGDLAVWIALAVSLAVALFPIYWMLNTSLKPSSEIFRSPPSFVSAQWSLEAYGEIFRTRPIARYLVNSLIVSAGATILSVVLASLAAYGFTRFFIRGANLFIIFLLFTKMLPETLLVVPYFQLMSTLGLINTYTALILAYSSFALPFSVWMLIGFFRTIPREIDEAARMDGCGPWRIYWRIMLPLSLPVMATASIFSFIWTYDNFLGPLIYLNDINLYTVPLALRAFVDSSGLSAWGQLFAMSTLSLVPLFIFFMFFQRLIIRGVATSAMKR